MKRINISSKTLKNDEQNPHFIGAWNLENNDFCKEIIDFFEDNKNLQRDGVSGSGKNLEIKKQLTL